MSHGQWPHFSFPFLFSCMENPLTCAVSAAEEGLSEQECLFSNCKPLQYTSKVTKQTWLGCWCHSLRHYASLKAAKISHSKEGKSLKGWTYV